MHSVGLLIDPGSPEAHYIIFFGSAGRHLLHLLIESGLRGHAGAGAYPARSSRGRAVEHGRDVTGPATARSTSWHDGCAFSSALRCWYIVAFSAAWAASVLGMIVWLRGRQRVTYGIVLAAISAVSKPRLWSWKSAVP
jgi:hypothetical protein